MIRGTMKSDGLVVAKITVDFLQNPIKVHAMAALVHVGGGQTLGWTEGNGSAFTTETMQKLQELREAMEVDLGRLVLADMTTPAAADSPPVVKTGGLAEHLGGGDAPSI